MALDVLSATFVTTSCWNERFATSYCNSISSPLAYRKYLEELENINKSETAKEESEVKLKSIEEKVANLEEEVDGIIKQSEANAELVGGQIISDANKSAENIKTNTLKLIENKTGVLKNDIMRRASLASVEVARGHIINELNNNADLHNKLIDESVEAINELEG